MLFEYSQSLTLLAKLYHTFNITAPSSLPQLVIRMPEINTMPNSLPTKWDSFFIRLGLSFSVKQRLCLI